jgi:hypothetical protein
MADDLDPYGIGAARKQGYGDSDIVDYVSGAMGVNPDEIKSAREQGFRDKDILNYLLPPPPKPEPIEPPKPEKLTAPEESRGTWGSDLATGYYGTMQAMASTVVISAAQEMENLRKQIEVFQQGDPDIPPQLGLMPQNRQQQIPALEKKLADARARYEKGLGALVSDSKELKDLAVNEPLQRFMGGELGEVMKNPGAVLRGLAGGSATAMVPIIVGTALGGVAGGAIVGGAIGATTGGGQQAIEILQKHKVDPRDINAVKAALADPEIKAEIDKAFGVAMAIDTVTGAATGGLGGVTAGGKTVATTMAKNFALQAGGQGTLSAGGEATKQAILDDKMNWGKVAASGVAEALFAPADIAASAFHGRGGKADTETSPRTPTPKTPDDVGKQVMGQDTVDGAIDTARRLITDVEIDELRARARDTEDPMEIAQADILGIFKDKGVLNGGDVFQRPDGAYVYQMPDGKTEFDLKPWDGKERPDTIPAQLAEVQKEVYGKQGIDVVYIENDANIPFDGVVNNRLFPNTIFLTNNTQRNAAQVTRHEWGHILEKTVVPGTDGVNLGEVLYRVVEQNMTPEGLAHVERLSGAEAPKRASYPQGAEGDALHQAAVKRFMVKEMIAEVGSETPHFPTYAVKVVDYVEARYGVDAAKQVVKDLIAGIREAMGRLQEFFIKPGGPVATQSQIWLKNLSEVHDVYAQIEAHRWGSKAEKENAALMAMRENARREQGADPFNAPAPELPPPWMPEGFLDPLPPSRISPIPGQPYNEARVRMEAYQSWIEQLDQKRRQEAAASPEAQALQEQIAGLVAKPRGRGEAGLTKRAAAQVADLRQQLDAMLNPTEPSPDMVRVQEAMLREQQRMADAAAVGTPSPGMERAAAAAGQPAAPVTGEAAPPAPVRGRAVMPEPVPAATRPITGEPVAAPPVAPVEVAPSTPIQAAAPVPAPTVPIVEGATAPPQLAREQAAVRAMVEPAAAAEPVAAVEPTASDYAAKVRAAREEIWAGEDMSRYSRSGKPIRQEGGGHLAPASVANERMVTESAREQVMREEAGDLIEDAVNNQGLPQDAVFEVAQLYRREEGETPQQAFDRATDRWMTKETADAQNFYGDPETNNYDMLKAEKGSDPLLAQVFDLLEEHYSGGKRDSDPDIDIPFEAAAAPEIPARPGGEAARQGEQPTGPQAGAEPARGGADVRAPDALDDGTVFSPRRADTEPAGPTLLETREATREELAARQRVADRQLAEVGMRGRQVSGAPQQGAEELPLFGGERQGDLLATTPKGVTPPSSPMAGSAYERYGFGKYDKEGGPDQGSLFSPRRPADPIDAAELTERAKALTGLTNNPREAGYITSDGAMLDLSGRHEAQDYVRQGDRFVARRGDYLGDTRNTDHRDIAQQLVESGGSEAMAEFMNRSGAVRVDFNSGIVHATVVPTPRQIQAIVRGARDAGLNALIVEHDGPDLKTISRADVQNITAQNIARVFNETLEGDTLFSPRPIQPTPEEHALSVNDILDPATPSMKPRSRKTQDIARELMVRGQKALIAMGIPTGRITGPNPQTDRMLARVIAAEAIRAFNERGAATDWYTSSFKEALAIAEVIHPELKDDPHQLFAFTATLAITSQGEKVQNNANLTDPIYEHFKETGRFPTDILGSKQKGPMNTNFKKLNGLLDAKGTMDEVIEFMNTEWTVRDLKKMGYKIGGENVDTVVFGSAILGPKIGQGFFQNLSGNYDPVTMDLWFMRAWGRLTGTLVGKQDLTKQTARMTNALEEEGMKVPQDTPGLIEVAEQTVRQHEKDFRTFRSEYDDGTRKKSEVVFASERLLHGLRGINESPKSGADRVWMRDVINQARRIAAYHEVPLTNADLQAVWWYPEKTLYEKLGGIPADEVNVDYAGAQRELARSKGIPDAEVDNVLRSLERRPGRSGGRDDDGRGDSAGVQERDRGDARPYLRDPLRTGISTPEEGTPGVNRLEVSGDSLFSPRTGEAREPAPVFYSALTRGVEGLKQTKAPPGQWAATIKNMPGIKAEEREWVGVEDWLAKQPKSVTKEELLDYIRANEIKVTETIKGDAMTPQQRNRFGELQDFIDQMPEGQVPRRILQEFNTLDAINRKTGGGQPKYEEWTLGGGKNYRELLLTLPIKQEVEPEYQAFNKKMIEKYGDLEGAFEKWTPEEQAEFDRVHALTGDMPAKFGDEGAFKGSHWQEPNVLAHIRFDDRWMGNQKVLHVAEIQSDWHQAGKKKGYRAAGEPDAAERLQASKDGLNVMIMANDKLGFDTIGEARMAIARDGPVGWEFNTPEDLAKAQEFYDAYQANEKGTGGVPDAPFKTTWPELAMKRVIRYAAENGYDRVTWDVGKTVADRFDLSQHISDVTLHGTGDNMRLTAHDRNGSAVVDMQHVTTETLPDYVGQDAADRLLAQPEPDLAKNPYAVRSLHSEDLKVGGEGMDAFYDKQLPILANKAGKKFGAKTEMDTLGAERTRSWEHFSAWVGEHPEFQGMTRDRQYQAWTRGEKSSLVLEYMRDTTEAPVHSFEITDALRTAAVEEGQTLFSPRNPANMGENPNRPRTAEQKAAFLKARAAPEATGLINAARQMWDNRSTAGKAVVREVFDPYIGVKSAGDDEGYVGLRIANSVAGAIEMFKRWGTLKIDGQAYRMDEKNGGVIDHLIRPLDKLGEATDFIWWVAGERADRLATQDRERLMDAPTIEAFKTLADGQLTGQWKMLDGSTTTDRRTAYGDALARLETFNKNALDLAVKSGLLKRTVARTDFAPGAEGDAQHAAAQGKIDALWENPFYVPFYRVVEDSNSRSFAGAPNKFGMVKQEAFKTLKGGEEKLNNDLWENAFGNWGHMIDASLRNQAATNVLTTAEQNGNVVTRLTRQEYDSVIDKKTKAETVWVMEDGEQVYFHVKDPFIFKAISALEYMQSDLPLMGLGRAAKKVLQIGTAMNPIFQVKNLIRDTINASAVSNINRNVISNWVRGFAAHDMKGDLLNVAYAVAGQERPENISRKMADAIAGGGVVRFAALNDAGVKDTTVANILDSPDKLKTFAGYFSRIGGAYAKLVGMTEGVNRYAFYDQLIKDGVPHDMASFAARDLNDITLKGASPIVRTILELRPFTGAWLQGIYKAGRSAANADESISLAVGGKLGKQAAWRLTQGVIVLATANLALHEIYKDDKDYLARDEYDQNSNFWFKAFGKEWRIPMGFEVGSLARMMAISAMAMYDKDMDFNRWRKNMFSIAQDNMMLGFVPQALSPIFEVARNESRTGSPIESQRLERVRPEARYTSESSMAARSASEGLNRVARFFGGEEASTYSPVQLDYLLRAYTGWLGHTASQIVDVALRGLSDEPTRPAKDWVGALSQNIVSETPSSERGSSRFISQLYNQGDSIKEAYNTYKELKKQGRPAAELESYMERNEPLIEKYRQFTKVIEREGKINEKVRRVENDREMSAAEKQMTIRELNAAKQESAMSVFRPQP